MRPPYGAVWRAQSDSVVATGSSVSRETWGDYRLRLNYSTGFGSLWIDGVPIVNDLLLGSNQDFARANFAVFTPGFDQAYFDDFRVAAFVPEPASAATMLAGLSIVIRRRRSRRYLASRPKTSTSM
ncbi:MAG: PEP-CTERM sorting domain-containing protein [Planctomycetota bacterium]|nr:MAG: PEP-CTERM sorting domain-containing protein [Planctomycetota bacterium]